VDWFAAAEVESDISESRVGMITSGHFLMIVLIQTREQSLQKIRIWMAHAVLLESPW